MKSARVLNLGAGTQSSVLLLWADSGEIPPIDVAVFADTQDEPEEVYAHLDWLEKRVTRTPIVRVSAGNLPEDAMIYQKTHESPDGRRFASLPLFVIGQDGRPSGSQNRQCTKYYKVFPVQDYIRRELLGLGKGERTPAGTVVTQVFGISFDERSRMRIPHVGWQRFDYPLVDRRMRRQQVIEWAEKHHPGHRFPRSACKRCPYRTNEEWRHLRDTDPQAWADVLAFDSELRRADVLAGGGGVYLHKSRVPLAEADLREDDERKGQLSLYGLLNECEGFCGV